jgi:Mn-dependent DtxR family transcriptional regulator
MPDTEKLAYTASQVADMMGLSRPTVTAMFRKERGVILMGRNRTEKGKRRYESLRIPHHVYQRVLSRLSVRCRPPKQ